MGGIDELKSPGFVRWPFTVGRWPT